MTDRPLIDEVREALTWYDRKCFSGTLPPQPGSLLARLDGMTIVPAGEVGLSWEQTPNGVIVRGGGAELIHVCNSLDVERLREALDRVMTNVVCGEWYDTPSADVAVHAVNRLHDAESAMWALYDEFGIDPGDSYIRRPPGWRSPGYGAALGEEADR